MNWLDHPVLLFLNDSEVEYSRTWLGAELTCQMISLRHNVSLHIFKNSYFALMTKKKIIKFDLTDPACFEKLIRKFRQIGINGNFNTK